MLLSRDFSELRALLAPGKRKQAEIHARLRPLLIMEKNLADDRTQPTTAEITRAATRLRKGEDWRTIFPGVASLRLDTEGSGMTYTVRFVRDAPTASGVPAVRLVRDDVAGEDVVLAREVDMLSRYSMGAKRVATHLGLTVPKTVALIRYLGLNSDAECYREFRVDSTVLTRYSPKALERIREVLPTVNLADVWLHHGYRRGTRPQQ